jgi:branched-chain amino acid transport system substrate-binding protein
MIGVVVALAALAGDPLPVAGADDIKIGVIAPFSGKSSAMGRQYKVGLDLAVAEVNGTGGLNGRRVVLLMEDDQGSPKEAASVAQKFAADSGVVAVIGTNSTTGNLASLPILSAARIPLITPVSSSTELAPKSPFMFQAFSTVDQYTAKIADFAVKDLKGKRIALHYVNDDWGREGRTFFAKRLKELGAELVAETSFKWGDQDFKAQMTEIRAANPDVIHVFGLYSEGALSALQARNLGIKAHIIGNVGLLFPQYIEIAGPAAEGTIASAEFFAGDPRPEVQAFVQKFKAATGEVPGVFSATAYDAIQLVFEAIRRGGAAREKVATALAGIRDFNGTTGRISFNQQRQIVRETSWVVVRSGKWTTHDK